MANFDMKHYAEAGARLRLAELLAEADKIRRAFPGIDTGTPRTSRGESAGAPARGRRSTMSAAERKAVSARMKAYWASRREAKAASEAEPEAAASAATAHKGTARKGGTKKR